MIGTRDFECFTEDLAAELYDYLYNKIKNYSYKEFNSYCDKNSLEFNQSKLDQAFEMAFVEIFDNKKCFIDLNKSQVNNPLINLKRFHIKFNKYCGLITSNK